MDTSTTLTLLALALVDSTSFGTLLIPLWLMMAPGRLRASRVLTFLGAVAGAYLALGLAVLAGASVVAEPVLRALDTQVGLWIQLGIGVLMFAGSFFLPIRKRDDGSAPSSRINRWRAKAVGAGDDASPGSGLGALVALALGAVAIEAASMLPYLAAIGLLSRSGLPTVGQGLGLAAYCTVMILPALVLLTLRLGLGARLDGLLRRFTAWIERQSGETVAWIVGIVGFLLVRDALTRGLDLSRWLN